MSYRYFAFISYSRKDSKAATWLQKRLEWFRVPIKLVAPERCPPHGRYVRPIYRNKTDLQVDGQHYWKNIGHALEQSRFLIVLCSPHAAVSKPVNNEVQHFLDTHERDGSSVIPVILDGHVSSSEGPDNALCPALRVLGDKLTSRNLPTMLSDAGGQGWNVPLLGDFLERLFYLERDASNTRAPAGNWRLSPGEAREFRHGDSPCIMKVMPETLHDMKCHEDGVTLHLCQKADVHQWRGVSGMLTADTAHGVIYLHSTKHVPNAGRLASAGAAMCSRAVGTR